MRQHYLEDCGRGESDIIRYDAGKVAEFIADMETCMSSYNTKASALETEYLRYYNNHTYVGKAAEASKEFINNGQVGRLHEGHHALMNKLYKRYVDIGDTFKSIVDTAPNARVDTEVMKKEKRDFSVYSEVTYDDAHFIESYAEEIKKRFEKYLKGEKGVTVPDYRPARETYEELCGEGGHLDESIDKCFEFDESALSDINRSGLEGQLYDHTRDITNVARALDGFRVYIPEVEKTSLSLLALNNAKAITTFNTLNPNKNNEEVVQLAKLLNVKCSLNTVVDAKTINTAAELMMLNCKTEQEKAAVLQCSASLIGVSTDVQTLYDIMGALEELMKSSGPYGAAFGLALLIVGLAALLASHADDIKRFVSPKDKEDNGIIIDIPPEQEQKNIIEGPTEMPKEEPSITDIPSGEVEEKELGPGEVFQDSKEDAPKITTIEGSDGDGYLNDDPSKYLDHALERQGVDTPPNRLKEKWVEGDYEYEVRIHEGESQYTDADSIYRVSRKSLERDANAQGKGREYLGSDGKWYRESTLKETNRLGEPNPNYNEQAAKNTHIPLER